MEPIRVLNLVVNMNRGGAETMIMNYYRNIDRDKIQFDFLVHREKPGVFEDEIEALGGRIYRINAVHPLFFKTYKAKIKKFFEEHKEYKIVHGHMSEVGYFAYRAAFEAGVPVIIAHAHLAKMDIDFKTPFRLYFRQKIKKYLTHKFACGLEAGKWLFGKKKLNETIIIKNAIDSKKFIFNKELAIKYKKDLAIEGKFVVGHVGRFCRQKNHDFLIDIFYALKQKEKDSVLLLVGEGTLKDDIEKKVAKLGIEDSVKFLGVRKDIESLINVFDIILFPSLYEGLPVSLIEAQANGLGCVVSSEISKETDLTGLIEFVNLSETGEFWADRLLKHKENLNRKNTQNMISESGYDIEKNAKWLSDFYINSIENINENFIRRRYEKEHHCIYPDIQQNTLP